MATTFQASDYTTASGKKVFTLNRKYHKELLDTVTDSIGRIWSRVRTTFEDKVTVQWLCEDEHSRLTMTGDSTPAEVSAMAEINIAQQFAIAQSKSVEVTLD